MTKIENIRKELKEKLLTNGVIEVIGAHNALGAKMAERYDFDAVWASGFEISASYAKPDANILTMTEFLAAAKQMAQSTNLPVIADCDTGFGDLNNVSHMVREYEAAGISAICIEDKKFPKTNSFVPNRQKLEDINVFCEKIVAAQNAKSDENFIVIARIESLIAGQGMEDALARAEAYKQAGADMILIHSKKDTADEVFEFSEKFKNQLPLAVVPTTYPKVSVKELQENNINMVIYANQCLRSSLNAMGQMLSTLKMSGNLSSIENMICSMSEIFELQGMNKMIEEEKLIREKTNQKVKDSFIQYN
ncbi:TPA: isocitrate lyase/phosphoenolpyruvate mutase family protein [Bacillus cereus]